MAMFSNNPDVGMAGLASLLATIKGMYPQAQVTSGYRGPNNPLTQRNPASMHAQGSPGDPRAVDVAPIPGMTFDNYVSSVRKAGVPVSQAFDEASHPFPWTTGPNWHIASGAPQVAEPRYPQPYYASKRKPQTLADINLSPRPSFNGPNYGEVPGLPTPPIMPMSLGDLGGSISMPQAQAKKPSLFGKGGLGWKVLGVLGDSYSEAWGRPGNYIPQLQHQQDRKDQQEFLRQQLDARLQMEREKALQPKPLTQTQQLINEVMDPNTPPQRKALIRAVLTRPLIGSISNPDGSQYQTQTYPGQDGGDDSDWESF
jgi:hypothetical protein